MKQQEHVFGEIHKSPEVLRAGDIGREIPAETLSAQAESLLLAREAVNQQAIREASPFSSAITERIRSVGEIPVYRQSGLEEAQINGLSCLTRSDIDPSIRDDYGRTNVERATRGLSPLDDTRKPIELHHIGQKPDSPLAELRYDEHKKNFGVLHERCESSIDRGAFATQRANHWKTRAAQIAA